MAEQLSRLGQGAIIVSKDKYVGIGTINPEARLQIDSGSGIGTIDSGYSLSIRGDGIDGIQILSDSAYQGRIIFGDQNNKTSGRIDYDHSTDAFRLYTNGTEKVSILSGGNVGIGIYNPDKLFVVQGDNAEVVINDTDGNPSPLLRFRENGTTSATIRTDTDLIFSVATDEEMRITSDGYVGIGTATPQAKLEVTATTHVSSVPTMQIYHRDYPATGDVNVPALNVNVGIANSELYRHGYVVLENHFTGGSYDSPNLFFKTNKNGSNHKEWWGVQAKANSRLSFSYSSDNTGTGAASASPNEVMSFSTNGNVGIGITNPDLQLHVKSSSGNSNLLLQRESFTPWQVSAGSTYLTFLQYGGSELLRIQNTGKVGIGTPTPREKLNIQDGNLVFTGSRSGNADIQSIIWHNTNSTGFDVAKIVGETGTNIYEGIIGFETKDSGGTMAERMRIASNGNVGIGTTDPSEKLHLYASLSGAPNIVLQSNAAAGQEGGGILFKNTANYYDLASIKVDTDTYTNRGDLVFATANTSTPIEAVRILGVNQNVGIGVDDPSDAKLVIESSSGSVGLTVGNTTGDTRLQISTTENSNVTLNAGDSAGMTTSRDLIIKTGSSERMRFQGSQIGIGVTAPYHALDIYSNTNVPLRIHRPSSPSLDADSPYGIGFSTRGDAAISQTDTRAGIFGHYNGNLFFSASASSIIVDPIAAARVYIKSTGSVGIGTTDPGAKLDIQGSTNSSLILTRTSSGIISNIEDDSGYGALALYQAGGGVKAYITGNGSSYLLGGNVGIGTSDPSNQLTLYKASGDYFPISLQANNIGTPGTYLGIQFGYTGGTYQKGAIIYESQDAYARGKMHFALDNGPNATNAEIADTIMTITSAGVGIGKTDPTARLDVKDNIIVRDTDSDLEHIQLWSNGTEGVLRLRNGANWGFIARGIGNSPYIGAYSGGSLHVAGFTNATGSSYNSPTMTFDFNNDRVGIGSGVPSSKLNVHLTHQSAYSTSSSSTDHLQIRTQQNTGTSGAYTSLRMLASSNNGTNNAVGIINLVSPTNGNNDSAFTFQLRNSSGVYGEKVRIQADGNVGIGTPDPDGAKLVIGEGPGANNLRLLGRAADGWAFLQFRDASNTTNYGEIGARSTELRFYQGGTQYQTVTNGGDIKFNTYGLGNNTGTSAYYLTVDSSGNVIEELISSGTPTGSGTTNYIPKWTGAVALGNSTLYETSAGYVGIGTTDPNDLVHIQDSNTGRTGIAIDNTSTNGRTYILGSTGSVGSGADPGSFIIRDGDASSNRFVINSSGYVGIGTTSPGHKLDITGGAIRIAASGETKILFRETIATDTYADRWTIGNDDAINNAFVFSTGANFANPKLVILDSDNVGIGATNPATKLQVSEVNDTSVITLHRDGSNPSTSTVVGKIKFDQDFNSTQENWGYIQLATTSSNSVRTSLDFYVKSTTGNLIEGMTIYGTNDGPLVGIGVVPSTKLHVSYPAIGQSGSAVTSITKTQATDLGVKLSFTGGDNSNGNIIGGIALGNGGEEYAGIYAVDGGSGAATDLALFAGDTNGINEAIRIDSGGNVGIGTTDPTTPLRVYFSGDNGALIESSNSHSSVYIKTNNGTFSNYIRFRDDTAERFYLQCDANHFLLFRPNATSTTANQVVINTSGNLGIGFYNATAKLQIGNGTTATGQRSPVAIFSADGGNATLDALSLVNSRTGAAGNGTAINFHNGDTWTPTGRIECLQAGVANTDSELKFYTYKSGTGLTQRMVVDYEGNVGIGTSDPTNPLDVLGKVSINTDGTLNWGNAKDYGRLTWDTGKAVVRGESGKALSLGANGTQDYIWIATDGKVGIGTTAPTSTLEVSGTDTVFTVNGTNGTLFSIEDDLSDSLMSINDAAGLPVFEAFADSHIVAGRYNQNDFYIASGGNVGIGTSNPTGQMEVYKSNSQGLGGHIVLNNNGLNTSNETAIIFGDGASIYRRGAISCVTESSPYSGSLRFKTGLSTYSSLATRMTIDGTGKVGIGTTTPGEKLHVEGNTRIFSAGYPYIDLGITTSNYWRIINDNPNDALNIGKNGAANLTITGGNVGIGTTDPSYKLDIDSPTGGGIRLNHSNGWPSLVLATRVSESAAQALSAHSSIYTTTPWTSGEWPFNTANGEYGALVLQSRDNGNGGIVFRTGTGSGYSNSLVVRETSNVGIGTTNPAQLLHTHKTSGNNAIYLTTDANTSGSSKTALWFAHNYTSSADWAGIIFDADDKLRITNSSSSTGTDIVINSSNKVGIGVEDPNYKLDIAGSLHAKDGNSAFAFNEYNNGATIWLDGADGDFTGGDYFNISANNSTQLTFGFAGGTNMTLTSGGNLGIGISNPGSYKLYVNGDVNVGGEIVLSGDVEHKLSKLTTSNITGVATDVTELKGRQIDLYAFDDICLRAGTGDNIKMFAQSGSEKITVGANVIINNAGNNVDFWVEGDTDTALLYSDASTDRIGIGTSIPNEKFTVSGNISASGTVYGDASEFGAVMEAGLKTENISELPEGTVLVWSDGTLVPCSTDNDYKVMGISTTLSDSPIILGAEPVLVTGSVNEGDYIITSDKQGHGRAISVDDYYAEPGKYFGRIIAQSLNNGEGDSYTIKAMIRKL